MANVPNVPGVPPLTSFSSNVLTTLAVEVISTILGSITRPWGIFLGGFPALDFLSMVDFEFRQDYALATYPVEPGSFLSYDKVQNPFEIRVRLTSRGTEADRQLLLEELQVMIGDLNLYTIVTPEQIYVNCNLIRYEFNRTASNGVGMIVVDLVFMQVRQSAAAQFTNTQQPGSAAQTGTGAVQPTSASTLPDFNQRYSAVPGQVQ